MARVIQASFPTEHAGIARITRGFAAAAAAVRSFDGVRGTATLLLAALVSALIGMANELVTTWTEGHLFAAWIVTWLVGFAALALLVSPARRAATGIRFGLHAWAAARRQRCQDAELWESALTDARAMADLSRAMSRDAAEGARQAG